MDRMIPRASKLMSALSLLCFHTWLMTQKRGKKVETRLTSPRGGRPPRSQLAPYLGSTVLVPYLETLGLLWSQNCGPESIGLPESGPDFFGVPRRGPEELDGNEIMAYYGPLIPRTADHGKTSPLHPGAAP